MVRIEIEFGDGYSISIPYSLFDINYEQFIDDFRTNERTWIALQKEHTKTPYDEALEGVIETRKREAIEKQIAEYKLSDEQRQGLIEARVYLRAAVGSLVEGDFDKVPFMVGDEVRDGFFYDASGSSDGDYPISVLHLYSHFVMLINGYQPEIKQGDPVFELGGKKYYFAKNEVLNGVSTGFSVGETVAVMSLRAEYDRRSKAGYDGDLDFSMSLREVAVICREDGVRLPSNPIKRNEYIENKVKEFHSEGITLGDVTTARFFFTDIIADCIMGSDIDISLSQPTSTKVKIVGLANGI